MGLIELLLGCATRQQQSAQAAPSIPAVVPAANIDPNADLASVTPGAKDESSAAPPQLEVHDDSAVDSAPIQAP
jgi:hypothetical protein